MEGSGSGAGRDRLKIGKNRHLRFFPAMQNAQDQHLLRLDTIETEIFANDEMAHSWPEIVARLARVGMRLARVGIKGQLLPSLFNSIEKTSGRGRIISSDMPPDQIKSSSAWNARRTRRISRQPPVPSGDAPPP